MTQLPEELLEEPPEEELEEEELDEEELPPELEDETGKALSA